MTRIVIIAVVAIALIPIAMWVYYEQFANPRVTHELMHQPDGERARKVMLITLPSGRAIPVNYYRDGSMVYAGADGRWWRELAGDGVDVQVLVRGETWNGRARAVVDDPEYRKRIFGELRPNAVEALGTLVEVKLGTRVDDNGGA